MSDEREPPHNRRPCAIKHRSARTVTAIEKCRLPRQNSPYYCSNIHPYQPGARVSNDIPLEALREW
jgi:hypothetical protein